VAGIRIDRASAADWRVVKEIRLRALAEAPYAFSSTLSDEQAIDDEQWRRRMGSRAWFLARDQSRPVGIAAVIGKDERPEERHLVSMWVQPDRRGSRVASDLVAAGCRFAEDDHAEYLTLWVADANPRARRFYQRLGFVPTGERQPMRTETPELGEQRMRLPLRVVAKVRQGARNPADNSRPGGATGVLEWPAADRVETERLLLEPLRVEHAEEMAPLLDDRRLHKFIGGRPASAAELRDRYARQVVGQTDDGSQGWCNWVVRQKGNGAAVGTVQATLYRSNGRLAAELAWVTASAYQGRGYASGAAAAMAGWLQSHGVDEFAAHVHPEHRASIRVAQHLGLAPTDRVDGGEVLWRR
jgi:RimJ/RimL family protein N-acetyltransferase